MTKQEFFAKAIPAAIASGHLFPDYAACEAALESAWGESKLAREANNLFGEKLSSATQSFDHIAIPTHEVLTSEQVAHVGQDAWKYGQPIKRADGRYDVKVDAIWPKFPDWEWSFRQRMATLERLPSLYGSALSAKTGEEFVRAVSVHWATDPDRASKCLATYRANVQLIQNAMTMAEAKEHV